MQCTFFACEDIIFIVVQIFRYDYMNLDIIKLNKNFPSLFR